MTATPIEQFVDVPGGRVWTGRYGDGPGVPLLVLHGGPGMPSYYLEPLTELGRERPVVFYDQLGCGRSGRSDDSTLWTVERAVTEVEAVREALHLSEVHVLGHSWGGFLALAHATQHGHGVNSLVLSSPLVSTAAWVEDAEALVATLPSEVQATIAEHERRMSFNDAAYVQATEVFYRRFFCTLDPWPAALERTMQELGEGPYSTLWGPSEFTQAGALRGADLTTSLSMLDMPSLWVGGDRDEVTPARLTGFAEQAAGRVEVFAGGSHCVHLEQTQRYLRVVGAFLAEVDAGQTGAR